MKVIEQIKKCNIATSKSLAYVGTAFSGKISGHEFIVVSKNEESAEKIFNVIFNDLAINSRGLLQVAIVNYGSVVEVQE